MITLEFKGQMVSGKNQQQIVNIRGRIMKFPNKKFKAWRAEFQYQMQLQLFLLVNHPRTVLFEKGVDVSLTVDYWPGDRLRRDCTGICDALFHAMELKNGGFVFEDDAQIKVLNFTQHALDRANPRAIVKLESIKIEDIL